MESDYICSCVFIVVLLFKSIIIKNIAVSKKNFGKEAFPDLYS